MRSAGYGKTQDYRLLDATTAPARRVPDKTLGAFYLSPSLITVGQSSFSLVLGRSLGVPFLHVGHLMTDPVRSDSSGPPRHIAIDLALAGPPAWEPMIRSLAVESLRDRQRLERRLTELLPWQPESPRGWDVDPNILERLLDGAPKMGALGNTPSDPTPMVALNDDAMRAVLAEELAAAALPSEDGALVVVTSGIEPRNLAEIGAWRALTVTSPPSLASGPAGPGEPEPDEPLGPYWRPNLLPSPDAPDLLERLARVLGKLRRTLKPERP